MEHEHAERGWPIVDRRAQIDMISSALSQAPLRAQVITGPAGVGKTVLARQVAERSSDRHPVAVIALTEISGVPLGAFAPALVTLGLGTEASAAIPGLMSTVGRDADRYMLVVDDAPRLDDLSAGAIYQLVRGFGVPLIATARLGERLPAPLGRLVDEDMVVMHRLAGLTVDQVDQLLQARFGLRVRHADVARLAQRTEGNPLYLRVLVEAAVRDDAVQHRDGALTIQEGDTPPDLLGSISDTLAGLPPEQRRTLSLVALTQPVDTTLLRFDADESAAADALLAGGYLVQENGSRRLRVAHPLVAEAVRRDRTLGPQIADAVRRLRATKDANQRFAAIQLQRRSGIPVPTDELVWAAERAFVVGDLSVAVAAATDALEATDELSLRFRSAVVVASSASMAGDLDQADAAFATAGEHARRPAERALLAARYGEHLAFRRFDVPGAVSAVAKVQVQLPPLLAATLDGELAVWRGLLGEVHERRADFSAAGDHPELAVRAAMATIMTESMKGRTDAARSAAAVLSGVQDRLEVLDPAAAAMIGFEAYFDLLSRGEHERALDLAETRRMSAGDGVGIWTCTVAEHRNYNGHLNQAHRLASLAVDQCRWRDGMGMLALALALQADTTAKLGDVGTARRILDSMEPAQRAEPKAAILIAECEAWLAHRAGHDELAASLVVDASQAAAAVGFRLVAAIALGMCIRLGIVDQAATLLEEHCREVPADFTLYTALRDLALGLRDNRPEDVPRAAVRLVAAGMAPTALDAIALALQLRPRPEVRRRLEIAAMTASAGIDAPLLQARPAALVTDRERHVALAAAKRARSREIAASLGVSVRTVDNQLQSVYRKLGVRSRDELREALIELGLLDAGSSRAGR